MNIKNDRDYPAIFVDFEMIGALPDIASIHAVNDAFLCSPCTISRFIQAYNVKRIKKGKKSFIDKESLIQALTENQAQPIHTIEA